MIPRVLTEAIRQLAGSIEGSDVQAGQVRPLGGGSINEACMVELSGRPYFVKWNSISRYPGMFEAEAHGLQLLASTNSLRIPAVAGSGSCGDYAFLMLEYIEGGRPAADGWERFGQKLAELHRNTNEHFGLDRDNYIGSLPQINSPRLTSWPEFFVESRLKPQLKMAMQRGHVSSAMQRQFEHLFQKMDQFFPDEPPALLHGDLWSGNYLFASNGEACLIDPAVYYGHREMDLAMSLLFGGFDKRFYDAYNEAWPLEKGWRARMDLCNLYPLLVHVNLFGGGYVSQVRFVLERFV